MIKAAILDDEIRGSTLLDHKIQELGEDILVDKIYNDPLLALQELPSLSIDVLFLDVEMPKLNGFQFLEQLGNFDFEVIFVTAYNEYALKALRADALDYLLKPVNPEELKAAVKKVLKIIDQKKSKIEEVQSRPKKSCNSKIALPTAEGTYFIKKCDILKVEAMSNYSVFYLANNMSKIIVSKTLKEFEQMLEDSHFLRINRGVIINLDYVVRYKKGDGGFVEMVDGVEIEVSSTKKALLMVRLFED